VETFTEARLFVENPLFDDQRRAALSELDLATIDRPIVEIVKGFAKLPYCFTLQSCFGHFLYAGQDDERCIDRLPLNVAIEVVEYRIAYIALCIEDSAPGKTLFDEMQAIAATDPENIQFGSADWFWERQLNSYALQVEPREHMFKDRCHIDYRQALRVEQVRNRFFEELAALLQRRQQSAS
jgi:hypothetical protein